MKTSFKIGEISGIPVRLHITLLIIIGFLAWSIGSNLFQLAELLPGVDPSKISPGFQSYLIGVIMAVGLFVSVFLHEVAHSLVARGMGVRIEEISLWIFGGMSSMEEIPRDPNSEIKMSIVGPLTSFGIGMACYSIGIISSPIAALSFIFLYLGIINVALGIFNLIPAFPMDGGRVLRASLAKKKTYVEATDTAATVGKVIAILMGISGLLIPNFFLILIAFFIYMGASQEAQSTIVTEILRKIKVKEIMSRDVKTVPPDMSVRDLLNYAWGVQHTGFPVVENGEIIGIVTLEDVKEIDRAEVDEVIVKDVMEEEVVHFSPEDVVSDVWQKMMKMDVGRFPIVSDGELVGIITRSDVMRSFRSLRQVESYRGNEI